MNRFSLALALGASLAVVGASRLSAQGASAATSSGTAAAASPTAASTSAAAPGGAPQAGAQTPPPPPARGPSLELALEAARAAVEDCRAKGFSIGASVVDSGGVLKALLAADGASSRGVQSSTNKAVTALTFGAPTSALGERVKTDQAFADKVAANVNYNVRAGAVLIKVGSDVIGAIGVGGARPSETDEACAVAGLQKVQARLK